jgi:hypothetical protein
MNITSSSATAIRRRHHYFTTALNSTSTLTLAQLYRERLLRRGQKQIKVQVQVHLQVQLGR